MQPLLLHLELARALWPKNRLRCTALARPWCSRCVPGLCSPPSIQALAMRHRSCCVVHAVRLLPPPEWPQTCPQDLKTVCGEWFSRLCVDGKPVEGRLPLRSPPHLASTRHWEWRGRKGVHKSTRCNSRAARLATVARQQPAEQSRLQRGTYGRHTSSRGWGGGGLTHVQGHGGGALSGCWARMAPRGAQGLASTWQEAPASAQWSEEESSRRDPLICVWGCVCVECGSCGVCACGQAWGCRSALSCICARTLQVLLSPQMGSRRRSSVLLLPQSTVADETIL